MRLNLDPELLCACREERSFPNPEALGSRMRETELMLFRIALWEQCGLVSVLEDEV